MNGRTHIFVSLSSPLTVTYTGIVHTILFNRALGTVYPIEVDSDVFPEISYVRCDGGRPGDSKVNSYVEAQVDRFMAAVRVCLFLCTSRPLKPPMPVLCAHLSPPLGSWRRKQTRKRSKRH